MRELGVFGFSYAVTADTEAGSGCMAASLSTSELSYDGRMSRVFYDEHVPHEALSREVIARACLQTRPSPGSGMQEPGWRVVLC